MRLQAMNRRNAMNTKMDAPEDAMQGSLEMGLVVAVSVIFPPILLAGFVIVHPREEIVVLRFGKLLGRPLRTCRTRSLSAAPPLRIRHLLTPTSLREDLRRGRRRLHGKQNARHPEMTSFSRPRTHGPHARVPTLRRSRYRDRRKAHYRLGRAHPWQGGFHTRWTANEISWSHRILQSQSTSRAWSH